MHLSVLLSFQLQITFFKTKKFRSTTITVAVCIVSISEKTG